MARTQPGPAVSESNLRSLAAGASASEILWVQRLRKSALDAFETLGLPTPRDEEWRQTNLGSLAATQFDRPSRGASLSLADFESVPLADLGCARLVMVNGRYIESLSDLDGLPAGVKVENLSRALESRPEELHSILGSAASFENRAFAALNTAAFEDGTVVTLDAGVVAERPIHIAHVTVVEGDTPAIHPRTLVVAGDNSQGAVIETYVGPAGSAYLTNAVTEVVLGDNANLDHVRVQWEGDHAYHIGSIQARQARSSNYTNHNISFGAALARHDTGSVLAGEGSEATLNGLYLATGRQHVDNHTILDHATPHCPSHELYKGILAGRAQAVFNGRIIVRPGAQKTDAKQSNKSMLLSNDALIHTRPQLEIYADDVKCTHGATIGHLEDDALFYLRSRGIGLGEARSILIYGFVSDILERLSYRPLRERLVEQAVAVMTHELTPEDDA